MNLYGYFSIDKYLNYKVFLLLRNLGVKAQEEKMKIIEWQKKFEKMLLQELKVFLEAGEKIPDWIRKELYLNQVLGIANVVRENRERKGGEE